jgi:TolB-like protein/Tfp pilus assembly protein PilF
MATNGKKEIELEIAHVLFIDIVGYSRLLIDEQRDCLHTLNEVVRATDAFRAADSAGKLTRLPTGDGMALVFATAPDSPVVCAMQIAKALQDHPDLPFRMGIHSGPVSGVVDVNERSNIAGAGINTAQRVMDCGDAGHILLSKRVADDLEQYRQWRPHLHELGECEVKHGVRVSVVNFYTEELGNAEVPEKFKRAETPQGLTPLPPPPRANRWKWSLVGAAVLIATAIAIAFAVLRHKPAPKITRSTSPPAATVSVPSIPEKSVAVLPFENLSSDKENAYFADGVQDEILTNLAKIADLKVISRTSVMQYKTGAVRNLREIGQQLGVAHLLEGSVQRAGNKVRVNAQLIDARTDGHQWAENYDRPLDDVFAIQSEIAKAIADQLRAKLSPGEKAAIEQKPTADLVANAFYVQARQLQFPREQQNLLEAVHLLDEAVARDPNFMLAYYELARTHIFLYWFGFDHTEARRELANAAIQKAAKLQPDAGEVHLALAQYALQGPRDYARARTELDLARRTLPNDPDLILWNAAIDRREGRWAEAVRNFERAVEVDPRNAHSLEQAALTYTALRQYDTAVKILDRALALPPRVVELLVTRSQQAFLARADIEPLRRELATVVKDEPGAAAKIADQLLEIALLTHDQTAANRALVAIPRDGISRRPKEWYVGLAARVFNDPATAIASLTEARAIQEKITHDQPDYPSAWSLLGRIDAELGRKEDAISEGRHACELIPLSKDALSGPGVITNLAAIYARAGERDLALEQLMISAEVPAGISYGELQLDPDWDPLRGDPRFEKIVASLAPKDGK